MQDDDNTSVPFTVSHAKMIADIHTALVGQPTLGNPGLVARLGNLEGKHTHLVGKVDGHDRKIWLVSIVFGALWAGLVTFKDNLLGK